jgi:hypothetical protein
MWQREATKSVESIGRSLDALQQGALTCLTSQLLETEILKGH